MRGSSGIDVSTRDVSLSLVCALGGRSVGRLFSRCRGVVAAADGELCRQAHKLCVVVMSDLSVCNVHAARVCASGCSPCGAQCLGGAPRVVG
jgi:hypothetical protein